MKLYRFLLLVVLPLLLISPIYAFQTKEAHITINVPDNVTAGQDFPVTFNIRYAGTKDWRDVCGVPMVIGFFTIPVYASCPKGLYLKVKWNEVEYRIADKVTTNTNDDIYWDYSFDGSIFTKTVTVTFHAPETPGTYYLYAELWVDEILGGDDSVASSSAKVIVNPKPGEEEVYRREERTITPSPAPTPAKCNVTITQVRISPSDPVTNEPVDITFKVSIDCPSGGDYGPFVKVHIKTASGTELYCFRLGDQGYTECQPIREPNYYFKPKRYTKEITITNLRFSEGMYKIYEEIKYSKPSGDDTLVKSHLLATFTVKKPEERVKQLITPAPEVTECKGRPIVYMATWVDENNVIKLSTKVNEKVYALIYFKNPYSACTYIGEVKVDIRKYYTGPIPDKSIDKEVMYVKIPPNSDKMIRVEFVPTEAGEYHYDVYWNNNKYSASDVSKHYSSKTRGTSDVLTVKKITAVAAKKPKEAGVQLLTAWFEKDGQRVYQVPENSLVRACVNLTASATIDGTVTINVKTLAGMPQLGLIGDVAPDPVKYKYTTHVILEAGKVKTVCTDTFVVRQSSALHNEQYYVEVLFNDEKLGIYPESKDGLIVIPKTGKGNPLIKGQDELANLVVLSHGWYASDGSLVSGTVPPGTYYVKAIVQNTGTADFTGTVTIVLKEDKDLQIDPTVATCPVNLIVKVNETKEVSCSFNLEDGKTYHYEVLVGDKKLVSRGPSIKVRSWWNIWAWISDVFHGTVKGVIFNPWTIIGAAVLIIIIIVVIITAPHWVPGVIAIIRLWRELYRR